MKWKRDLSTSFWHTVNFSILFWWKFDNGQPEVAGFQTFSNGFEFCSFFFCLPPPSISVAPWNSNVPLRLTQVTCLQKEVSPKKNAWEKQCQIKRNSSDTSYLSSKRSFALRLSLEVRRGGVVAGGSHKSKMVQFSSQLLPECTHSVFAANVPNKDLEVSHLRQKPHQDLWGHISGGEDQSWEPPLTNSWAFLPPVRNWGSCQDLVLPLHPLGAQGTATTIGVE